MSMAASLEALVHHASRCCTRRLHPGTRALVFLQHFTYCSSASSPPPSEEQQKPPEPPSGPAAIKLVSYAPKPKEPNTEQESEADRSRSTWNFSVKAPSEGPQGDSIARPSTREESRYFRDTPSIPTVSYGVRVAPLPEDRAFEQQLQGEEHKGEDRAFEQQQQGEEHKEEDVPRVEKEDMLGLKGQLAAEARRLQVQFFAREEDANIPFPKLVTEEKKERKPVYDLNEAIRQVKANVKCKFDETVEAHVRLFINPKRSDQAVRGGTALPRGIGKPIRVAVFADGEAADEARAAGADIVGGNELINEIKEAGFKGDFDKCIATPAFMPRLGKIGKVLGPRGLMPNPKAGTVTNDVAEAIRESKKGRIDFKMDKSAIVHVGLGKASFKEEALRENIAAFLNALLAAKPVGLKKSSRFAGYIKTFTLTSTMGPGFRVSIQSLTNVADQHMKLRV